MDTIPISTSQESQNSHTLNIESTPPEPIENPSHYNVFVSCFLWVVMALAGLVYVVLYPFYWLLKKIWKYTKYYIMFFVGIFVLWFIGTLSSVTFPFLLIALLVLRFLQFIKRGEEYDKITQVKMVIEWYMFINSALLVFAIAEFGTNSTEFSSLKFIKVMDKPLRYWGDLIFYRILLVFAIRFILFWVIQRYMPRMTLEHNESGLRVIQATCDIVDCLLFLYAESVIMNSLTPLEILGLPTRNWIEVTIFVVIGWNIIALLTHSIVWSIHKLVSWYLNQIHDHKERSHRYLILERFLSVHYLVYYVNGIKRSFNFMLSSLLLLLVWVLYFGSHLSKKGPKAETVKSFGTGTCTVMFMLSLLWVLKDFVLLSWEAKAVYERLSCKISEARELLYFLGILRRYSHDILKLRYKVVNKNIESNLEDISENKAQIFVAKNLARVDAYYQDEMDEDDNGEMEANNQLQSKLSVKKKARAENDLVLLENDTMTLFNVQQVAQYFLTAANALLKETYTSDILSQLNSSGDNREILEKITGKNNVSDVVQSSSDSSSYACHSTVKTWLEKSHIKCLFLANTLCSAKELVDCLNNIISVLLICASFILWLIFTGLADTKALVLIASPLLAATFVFGDSCKSLFQGIIFVYVVHPFDVGDLCVIDEKMMEVKSIGVWKTIFSNIDKAGTHEEVIYLNSELAMKTLINHKTEIDWNDSVQFDVEHLGKQQIKELKRQIEDILDANHKDNLMPGSHIVAILSTGKEVKIVVRFRRDKLNEAMTCFKCLKKDKLRSALISAAQNLANENKEDEN